MEFFEEKEGNIFFIPLFLPNGIKDSNKNYKRYKFDPESNYAFGRLIETNKSSGDLVEVFNYTGKIPINADVILSSGRLFKPLHVAMGFNKGRWRFVFENIQYDKSQDSNYQDITFLLGDRLGMQLWKGGEKEKIEFSEKNTKLYEEWIVYAPTQLEKMTKEKIDS